jgi:hypothetical protein
MKKVEKAMFFRAFGSKRESFVDTTIKTYQLSYFISKGVTDINPDSNAPTSTEKSLSVSLL